MYSIIQHFAVLVQPTPKCEIASVNSEAWSTSWMFLTLPLGGHWPRKGVWGYAALKTPFSRLSCRSQGSHFKQKSQLTRPPFEKILPSTASIFTQILAHKPPNLEIFCSQAPKFGSFQLTSPQIWKFSAHKPPFSEANVSSQAPYFGNPGRTPLPEKKLSAPGTLPLQTCRVGWLHTWLIWASVGFCQKIVHLIILLRSSEKKSINFWN